MNHINIPLAGWTLTAGGINVRKNGVITGSGMDGYPISYYSMSIEAFGKIGLVQGRGSLQYGAQFGVMLNFMCPNDPILHA